MNRSALALAFALLFIAPAQADNGSATNTQQFKDVADGTARSEALRLISGYLRPTFPSVPPLRCEALIAATSGKVETIYVGSARPAASRPCVYAATLGSVNSLLQNGQKVAIALL